MIGDSDRRLKQVFLAVFPKLAAEDVETASVETLEAWDSLAGITILTLLEETFQIQLDPLLLVDLTSFVAIRNYLIKQGVVV